MVMVRQGSWWHNNDCSQRPHCSTIKTNRENNEASQTIIRLHRHARVCYSHLPKKWHGTSRPQQRRLSQQKNARNWAGGHHFLSKDVQYPPNNSAILNVVKIIQAVMSSAAEATLGRWLRCAPSCKKWGIHSHQLPCKRTTRLRRASSTAKSNRRAPKQWTFVFTGCKTAGWTRNNSVFIGALDHSTMRIGQ